MANYCVNRSHPKFKELAIELNVSLNSLELIAHEYNMKEGNAEAFLSDSGIKYIKSRVKGESQIVDYDTYKLWAKSYSTVKEFTTLEEANATKQEALKYFDSKSVVVNETSTGTYTLSVATPKLPGVDVAIDSSMIDYFYNLSMKDKSNPYNKLFKDIIDILEKNNIPVSVVADFDMQHIAGIKQDWFRSATVRFNPQVLHEFLMTDSLDKVDNNIQRILTHELIHGITATLLETHPSWADIRGFDKYQKEFVTKISDLYDTVLEAVSEEEVTWYGLTNKKEFVAEALSNPEFQKRLSEIPYKTDKSIWGALVELFNKFFEKLGIKTTDTALGEILNISQEYFDYAKKGMNLGIDDYNRGKEDKAITERSLNWVLHNSLDVDNVPTSYTTHLIRQSRNGYSTFYMSVPLDNGLTEAEKYVEAEKVLASSLKFGNSGASIENFKLSAELVPLYKNGVKIGEGFKVTPVGYTVPRAKYVHTQAKVRQYSFTDIEKEIIARYEQTNPQLAKDLKEGRISFEDAPMEGEELDYFDTDKSNEERIQKFVSQNQKFYNQLQAIQDSGRLSSTEVRQVAASVAYAVSDLITNIQEGRFDINDIIAGKQTSTPVEQMSRAQILQFIGVDNAFNYVKKTHFGNVSNAATRADKRAMVTIYENFEAIKELSAEEFVNVEGFGLKFTEGRQPEIIESLNINIDDVNNDEDASAVLEREGDLQEHWQVNFRTIDVLGSMSQIVRQALLKCYKLDKEGNPVKSRFGIAERVSAREATNQILRWTQGAVDMNSMIALLEQHTDSNPWIKQIIQRLTDKDKTKEEYGADTDFRSQFYSVFSKHFQVYTTVIKDKDGNFYSKTINEHPALTDLVNQIQIMTSMGQVPMFSTEGINQKALDGFSSYVDNLNVTNIKEFENLSAEEVEDLQDYIWAALSNLGVLIPDTYISENWNFENYKDIRSALIHINNTLKKNINNPTYNPFEFKGGIKGNLITALRPLVSSLEDIAVSSFYDNGKTYQSYVTPSYLTKFMQKMHLTGEEFDKFIENEFGKYDWFKNQETGEWRNTWLKAIVESEERGFKVGNIEYRDLLAHKVELNFNKKSYMRGMSPAEYTLSMLSEYFTVGESKDSIVPAWYRVPMLSNKPSSEFIRFTRYANLNTYKEEVINDLMQVFAQELSRIQTVKERNKKYSKDSLEFIKNFDKNGSKFNFFPFLNNSKNNTFKSLVERKTNGEALSPAEIAQLDVEARKELTDYLNTRTAQILSQWEKDGVLEAATSIKGLNKNNVKAQLENFIWNDTLASKMILEMFVTDIALYKNTEDLQKRLAQIHAPGVRGDVSAVDYEGNPVSDGTYRTLLLTDFDDFKSNIIANLEEVFERKREGLTGESKAAAKAFHDSIIKQFEEINVADAQGYSSPTSRRKKDFIMGLWSRDKEAVYQRVINNEYTDTDLKRLMDIANANEPEKPFVYSQIEKESGVDTGMKNLKLGVQFKNSEYMLIMADAILQNERTGRPNLLRAVYKFMEDSALKNPTKGIDTIQFESTSKALVQGRLNIKQFQYAKGGEKLAYDFLMKNAYQENTKNYNPIVVHEVPFEDWCLQQQVPNHFYEHAQAHGSQIRMITPSDLLKTFNGEEVFYEVYGEKYGADEFRKEYEDTIAANIQESLNEVAEELGLNSTDRKERNVAIAEILQREIKSSPRYGTDLLKACTLNDEGEFMIPLGDPIQAKRIEQLLNSIIKNRVNKQEIAGGPVVQVSNFGTSRELNIRFKNKKGCILKTELEWQNAREGYATYKDYIKENQGGIAYYEVFAPRFEGIEAFEDKYGNIDIEAIEKTNPELLDMICYRIPTEDKYSCAPCKIVGFLPKSAGAGIMMPNDITLLTGSDFDVDKMYCMRKEFKMSGRKVESYAPDTRQGRNNKIVEMTKAVLTHESTVDKIMNPGGFEPQKKMGYMVQAYKNGNTNWDKLNEMTVDELKDLSYKESDLTFIDTQVQFYKQNSAAGSILAIFAVAKVAHATLENNGFKLALDKTISDGGIQLYYPLSIAGFKIGSEQDMSVEIDPTYDIDGNPIGKSLGNLVASAADAVKDPVLNLMNINKETVNVLNTLIRIGMPFEKAALFLSQDVITKTIQYYYKESLSRNVKLNDIVNEILDNLEIRESLEDAGKALKEDISEASLIKGLSDSTNTKHNYQVLYAFNKILDMSNALRGINFATRFNSISSAVGPLVIDNIIKENKMGSSSFSNIVDCPGITTVFEKHPILGTFADTLFIARQLFEETPEYSNAFMDALSQAPTGFDKRILNNRDLLNKYSDFFKSYALLKAGVISSEETAYYVNEFAKEFVEIKSKDEYKDNPLISNLRIAVDKKNSLYIKVPDGLLNDQTLKESMSAAWIDLLRQDKELAIKLFKYCFFRGGIGFTPKTFMSLVPVELKMAIEKYADTFRDIDKVFSGEVIGIVDQFVQNNWEDNYIVPQIKIISKNGAPMYKRDSYGNITISSNIVSAPYFKTETDNGYTLYKRRTDVNAKYLTYTPIPLLGGNRDFLDIHLGDVYSYNGVSKLSTTNKVEESSKTDLVQDSGTLEDIDDGISEFISEFTITKTNIDEEQRTQQASNLLGYTENITLEAQQKALEAVTKVVDVNSNDINKTLEDKNIC